VTQHEKQAVIPQQNRSSQREMESPSGAGDNFVLLILVLGISRQYPASERIQIVPPLLRRSGTCALATNRRRRSRLFLRPSSGK
jgi:hypothetical protein